MRLILIVLAWFVLLAVSWPLALLVLALAPLFLLLALLVMLVMLVVFVLKALFALLGALLMLPARVLGYRG